MVLCISTYNMYVCYKLINDIHTYIHTYILFRFSFHYFFRFSFSFR